MKKALQNEPFAGRISVSERGGRPPARDARGGRRRPSRRARRHRCGGCRLAVDVLLGRARRCRACPRPLAGGRGRHRAGRRSGAGAGGASPPERGPRRPRISASAGSAGRPRPTSRRCTCSVPSRAIRAGHARRRSRGRPRGARRGHISAMPASPDASRAQQPLSSRRGGPSEARPSPSGDDVEQLCRLDRQRLGAGGGHERLAGAADPLARASGGGRRRAPRGRRRGGAAEHRAASARSSASREEERRALRAAARPASRTCAGRASPARSGRRRGAGRDPSRPARGRGRGAPRASRPSAARPRIRASPRRGRARRRAPANAGAEESTAPHGGRPRAPPRAPRPGPSTARATPRTRHPLASAPQRSVPLAERRSVLRPVASPRPGASRAERAVEVRASGRGTGFDDGQAVGREHERRELSAQLLGGAQRRAVQPSPASPLPRRAATSTVARRRARERPARATRAALGAAGGRAGRQSACEARNPACRRAAPRAGWSCRRRCPVTSTRPGSSARSRRAYDRKSRSGTWRTISLRGE